MQVAQIVLTSLKNFKNMKKVLLKFTTVIKNRPVGKIITKTKKKNVQKKNKFFRFFLQKPVLIFKNLSMVLILKIAKIKKKNLLVNKLNTNKLFVACSFILFARNYINKKISNMFFSILRKVFELGNCLSNLG